MRPSSPSSSSPSPRSRTPMFHPFCRRPKKEPMFVAADPSSKVVSGTEYVRSVSNSSFYDVMFPSLGGARETRKTSEPASIGSSSACRIITPPTSQTHLLPISINTFGGETAGSGMDYVTTMIADDEESCKKTIRLAQQMALSEMRQDICRLKREHEQMEADEVMLRALLRDDLGVGNFACVNEAELDRELLELEESIEAIRKRHPNCVPPPSTSFESNDVLTKLRRASFPFLPVRPRRASPEHEEWRCFKCTAANHFEKFQCIKCGLPRLIISPDERARCACERCRSSSERLSVTPADDGTDWMLVNS